MNDDGMKEVFYDRFCENCKYWKVREDEDPCDKCLEEPVNFESHKPVYWEKE